MNKNAREKEFLEEAYASLYERKNPDADTYGGGLTGPFELEQKGPNFEDDEGGGCPNLDKLIGLAAAAEDAEGDEEIGIDDQERAAKFEDLDTPL